MMARNHRAVLAERNRKARAEGFKNYSVKRRMLALEAEYCNPAVPYWADLEELDMVEAPMVRLARIGARIG